MLNNKLVDIAGLQRYHENLKTVLNTKATAAALADEATARAEEDARLAAMVAGEAEQREGEMADMKAAYTAAIAAEATARAEANDAISATVEANKTAIETALDAEATAREEADAAITATVEENKTAIETALASEKAVRAEEDARLAGLIDSEAETRMGEMADMKDAYTAAIGAAETAAKAHADALNTAMDTRVKVLEAIDHDKIAADAVAAVVAGAESDFDTLKEVADWINSDTTGAAALQATVSSHTESISALETDLAAEATAREEADTTIRGEFAAADEVVLSSAAADAKSKADTALADAKSYADGLANTKQDTITDLADIRSGAAAGATALQVSDLQFATDADIDALFA